MKSIKIDFWGIQRRLYKSLFLQSNHHSSWNLVLCTVRECINVMINGWTNELVYWWMDGPMHWYVDDECPSCPEVRGWPDSINYWQGGSPTEAPARTGWAINTPRLMVTPTGEATNTNDDCSKASVRSATLPCSLQYSGKESLVPPSPHYELQRVIKVTLAPQETRGATLHSTSLLVASRYH